MKTYNHKNENLISEESLAIIHKNAKTRRIQKSIEYKRNKRNNILSKIFFTATVIGFFAFMVIGALYLG